MPDVDALRDDQAEVQRQLQPAAGEDQVAAAARSARVRSGVLSSGVRDRRKSRILQRALAMPAMSHSRRARRVSMRAASIRKSTAMLEEETHVVDSIESVLQREPRVPAAARSSSSRRTSPAWTPTASCAPRPSSDFEGFWARLARENLLWQKPFTKTLDESKAPFFKWFDDGELNASYNCLDRHLEDAAGQDRDHLRGRRRQGHARSPTRSCYAARLPVRQRLKALRHQEGRPRHHLHADVDRGGGRDAGLRAHRRDALGGVRRLLGEERCRSASSTPARWR